MQEVSITANNPLPQTTVVPVEEPVEVIGEQTSAPLRMPHGLTRQERRAWQARQFADRVDSLVQSRNYLFWPNSMQQLPHGNIELIYNGYYYFGLYVDHVEVHLPTERGSTGYVEMVNFDSMSVKEFALSRQQSYWSVGLRIPDGDICYIAELRISTVTGESILTLITPYTTMRYVGTILDRECKTGTHH